MTFEREMDFLTDLHTDLNSRFPPELAHALFGAAASEFFAGPQGVARMFERHSQFRSKPTP